MAQDCVVQTIDGGSMDIRPFKREPPGSQQAKGMPVSSTAVTRPVCGMLIPGREEIPCSKRCLLSSAKMQSGVASCKAVWPCKGEPVKARHLTLIGSALHDWAPGFRHGS